MKQSSQHSTNSIQLNNIQLDIILSTKYYELYICITNLKIQRIFNCPVGWGCRIHRLHLCKEVRPYPQHVSWIWHLTIWWWDSSNAGALGNAEYPFIAIAPGGVAPARVLSMGQIERNCVLMVNWIVWNRTVFDIETVLTLNWTVWIRTVWLNWIAWNRNVFDN